MVINGKSAAAALVKARAAIGSTVTKDARANYGKYATLAAVMEAITPALAANGLALVQEAELDDAAVTMAATLIHESGETIEFAPLTMPLGSQRTPQAVGSAMTYGRRYQLTALFGLAPDDDDGEAASKPSQTAPGRTERPSTPNHAATAAKAPQRGAVQATAHIDDVPPVNPDGPEETGETLFETATPTEREAAILNRWQTTEDAVGWATRLGGSKNEFEARNSYKKIVREQFGGSETDANRASVWLAYMRHEGGKWRERTTQKEAVA